MKNLKGTFVALIFLLGACTETKVDPRQQYVGSWNVIVHGKCWVYSDDFTDAMQIANGSDKDKIVLVIDSEPLNAILFGRSFTIPTQIMDGNTQVTGYGSFSGKSISATLTSNGISENKQCFYRLTGTKN